MKLNGISEMIDDGETFVLHPNDTNEKFVLVTKSEDYGFIFEVGSETMSNDNEDSVRKLAHWLLESIGDKVPEPITRTAPPIQRQKNHPDIEFKDNWDDELRINKIYDSVYMESEEGDTLAILEFSFDRFKEIVKELEKWA